jgi:hypothetical protein
MFLATHHSNSSSLKAETILAANMFVSLLLLHPFPSSCMKSRAKCGTQELLGEYYWEEEWVRFTILLCEGIRPMWPHAQHLPYTSQTKPKYGKGTWVQNSIETEQLLGIDTCREESLISLRMWPLTIKLTKLQRVITHSIIHKYFKLDLIDLTKQHNKRTKVQWVVGEVDLRGVEVVKIHCMKISKKYETFAKHN